MRQEQICHVSNIHTMEIVVVLDISSVAFIDILEKESQLPLIHIDVKVVLHEEMHS